MVFSVGIGLVFQDNPGFGFFSWYWIEIDNYYQSTSGTNIETNRAASKRKSTRILT